jgi:hypothetical protein
LSTGAATRISPAAVCSLNVSAPQLVAAQVEDDQAAEDRAELGHQGQVGERADEDAESETATAPSAIESPTLITPP